MTSYPQASSQQPSHSRCPPVTAPESRPPATNPDHRVLQAPDTTQKAPSAYRDPSVPPNPPENSPRTHPSLGRSSSATAGVPGTSVGAASYRAVVKTNPRSLLPDAVGGGLCRALNTCSMRRRAGKRRYP